MAVLNKYIDPDLQINQKQDPNKAGGSRALVSAFQSFEVAASDDNDSVYRIGRINSNAMIYDIVIACTAMTGSTDWDLGFYEVNFGPEVDKDVLMDGQTFASASRTINGMAAVTVPNLNKRVYELLGLDEDPLKQYDLALTANTIGSANGSVTLKVMTAQY
jgi:hypothetical protein